MPAAFDFSCEEDLHLPLYDTNPWKMNLASCWTMPFCVVFKATPTRLGLMIVGFPSVLEGRLEFEGSLLGDPIPIEA